MILSPEMLDYLQKLGKQEDPIVPDHDVSTEVPAQETSREGGTLVLDPFTGAPPSSSNSRGLAPASTGPAVVPSSVLPPSATTAQLEDTSALQSPFVFGAGGSAEPSVAIPDMQNHEPNTTTEAALPLEPAGLQEDLELPDMIPGHAEPPATSGEDIAPTSPKRMRFETLLAEGFPTAAGLVPDAAGELQLCCHGWLGRESSYPRRFQLPSCVQRFAGG